MADASRLTVTEERGADVRALLARVFDARFDTTAGAYTVEDAMQSDQVWAARDGTGRLVLAWSMNYHRDRNGVRAFVTGCAGRGMMAALPHCERIAREAGANRLAFRTVRPGMIDTMGGAGFVPRCVEMEKPL